MGALMDLLRVGGPRAELERPIRHLTHAVERSDKKRFEPKWVRTSEGTSWNGAEWALEEILTKSKWKCKETGCRRDICGPHSCGLEGGEWNSESESQG